MPITTYQVQGFNLSPFCGKNTPNSDDANLNKISRKQTYMTEEITIAVFLQRNLIIIFSLENWNTHCPLTKSMVLQSEFTLQSKSRGFHLITDEIVANLPELPKNGLLHLFIKHTSAALTINENCDPDVRTDLESIFNHLVKERQPYYEHILEGDDDMPAHAKSTIIGAGITIPITNGCLNLGTWQGIYLCEFRNRGGRRNFIATVIG